MLRSLRNWAASGGNSLAARTFKLFVAKAVIIAVLISFE
jgi:hypothetical protein